MRKLACFSLVIPVFLFVVIAAIIMSSHSQPLSSNFARLQYPDCTLPCVAGMTLGKSTPKDVDQQITNLFAPYGYVVHQPIDQFSDKYLASNGQFAFIEYNQNRLLSLYVGDATGDVLMLPTVGEIVSVLGAPTCGMTDDMMPHRIWLLFVGRHYNLTVYQAPFSISASAGAIEIDNDHTYTSCWDAGYLPWRGFGDVMLYHIVD